MLKKILMFLAFISLIILINIYESNKIKSINKNGLEDLNLMLVGVVDSVDNAGSDRYHGRGIISVSILKSNVIHYDPRSKLEYFYCIIKGTKAELYDNTLGIINGDTLKINTKTKTKYWTNKGKTVKDDVTISTDEDYYTYISTHHIIF